MKLAVAGRDDLDTLEKMVRDKFSAVPTRTEGRPLTGPNGVRVTFDDSPYDANMRGVSSNKNRAATIRT
jgi:insulysin